MTQKQAIEKLKAMIPQTVTKQLGDVSAYETAVTAGLDELSAIAPQVLRATGTAASTELPDFDPNFSYIREFRPAVPSAYWLPPNVWTVNETEGAYTVTISDLPPDTAVQVEYTCPHRLLSATDPSSDEATLTVAAGQIRAYLYLAGATLLRRLALHYMQSRDDALQISHAQFTTRSQKFDDKADKWEEKAKQSLATLQTPDASADSPDDPASLTVQLFPNEFTDLLS